MKSWKQCTHPVINIIDIWQLVLLGYTKSVLHDGHMINRTACVPFFRHLEDIPRVNLISRTTNFHKLACIVCTLSICIYGIYYTHLNVLWNTWIYQTILFWHIILHLPFKYQVFFLDTLKWRVFCTGIISTLNKLEELFKIDKINVGGCHVFALL